MLTLAETFDQMPLDTPADPLHVTAVGPLFEAASNIDGLAVIEDFNTRVTWPELLEPDGWTLVYERGGVGYWRRPGKDRDHQLRRRRPVLQLQLVDRPGDRRPRQEGRLLEVRLLRPPASRR
jgi:hypothetical protein